MNCKVALISIGNELLSGRTLNSNLLYLGEQLNKLGLSIVFSPVIRDCERMLSETLHYCLEKYDIIITTGGLGPTFDDITKEVVADYFEQPLIFDEEVWESIQKKYPGHIIPLNNRKQAFKPKYFSILDNDAGISPGFYYATDNHLIILLPGVPVEMKHIFENKVTCLLKSKYHLPQLIDKTLHTIGITESSLYDINKNIAIPDHVELAYLPQTGRVDLRIIGSNLQGVEHLFNTLREKLSDYVWGYNDDSLPKILHNLLLKSNKSLAVAESCTGGLVQQEVTAIPKASLIFKGGMVVYGNKAKIENLNVPRKIIAEHGAVSTQTAIEMAKNIRKLFDSDIGVSITGIAGPTGGTKSKPVGTVYFAIDLMSQIYHYRMNFRGNRNMVREQASNFLMYNLIKVLSTT